MNVRLLVVSALLAIPTFVVACGDSGKAPSASPSPTDPSSNDAGGDGGTSPTSSNEAGAPDAGGAGDPISAPPDQWTWVDFPESRCLHGSSTGIAVKPHAGSSRLVIFLQGGGSCTTCWGATPEAKVGTPTSYGAAEFAVEEDVGNAGNGTGGDVGLNGSNAADPYKDDNVVFIPYCTGDLHSGTATVTEGTHTTNFWGAKDMDMFLPRIKATFANPTHVTLAGTSAGGFGTTLNYGRVQAVFGGRLDLVADSAPPMTGPADQISPAVSLWGSLPIPGCPLCLGASEVHDYNRSLDASSRFAFIGYRYDKVIGADLYGTDLEGYAQAIDGLVTKMAAEPNTKTFIVDNTAATANHVVMNKPHYSAQVGAWLTTMTTDDPAWASTKISP